MKKDNVNKIIEQWNKEMPELNTDTMEAVGRLGRVVRYIERRLHEDYSKNNLNSGEFDVLATLKRSGKPYKLKPTELFNTLMITSGAMTNRIDTLEKKGLVERVSDPGDRRAMFVQLTIKGDKLISSNILTHVEVEEELLKSLDKNEVRTLTSLLSKLLIDYEN